MDGCEPGASDHILESDGSYCLTEYLNKCDPTAAKSPTVICFHGSGTDHLRSWKGLLENLSQQYPTLFFDRGLQNPSPEQHIVVLWNYLKRNEQKGPFILVAHSYGGVFAKQFLRIHRGHVAGIVLAETGKGGSSNQAQESLVKKGLLVFQPLSVIRANSFLRQRQALEAEMNKEHGANANNQAHMEKREWLQRCEAEDEKLETDQLKISHNSRLLHLPDCGHNVVLERPDVVVQEVRWVVEQLQSPRSHISWSVHIRRLFSTLR